MSYFSLGWPSSHSGMTFISVSGHLPVNVYMIWSKNGFAPRWFHPGTEDRDEIIPGRTHFCSKSCKHFRCRLHELFHPGMSFTPGWLSTRCLVIYLWVFTWFGAKMCSPPRDEIIPGRTHFCSKSCKWPDTETKVIPGWDEGHPGVKLIPGWNNSCKRCLKGKWPDTEMKVIPGCDEGHPGVKLIPGW